MLSVLLLLGVVCHFVNRHCYFASSFFQVLMQSLVLCLPSKGQGMSKLSIDFPFTTFLIESYLLYLCKAFSSACQ